MVTIQEIANKELEKNPILIEMIHKKLVNISAAAKNLHTKIEKEIGKKVEVAAVSMAIRRFILDYSAKPIFQFSFPKDIEIATKSKIYEVAIEKTPEISKILEYIYAHIKRHKGEFLSVVEGTYEIVIFTNQKNKQYIQEALRSQNITSECNDLAYATINWEKTTKDIPGIYYQITRELALKNISIQSVHTIGAEMMILVKEDALVDAYRAILDLLKR